MNFVLKNSNFEELDPLIVCESKIRRQTGVARFLLWFTDAYSCILKTGVERFL
jgi:hypothetical protein